MKNTLLAVLVISLCYYDSPAQNVAPHSPRYVKYQEAISNRSIGKGAKKVNPFRDGVASTDKLTKDIAALNKMADGTASSDKLADILLNSLEIFDSVGKTDKPAFRVVPVGLYTYAGFMRQEITRKQELSKPRPLTTKKSGWLL
ncbi:hypothetical protein A4H97_03855 [Niastella yeongjuensis]|uniref:Uncharacterized protein n=1 Tax=Niastella yeongjuensis TaxID=354355 RepID=A0A1V9EY40_9BACT|nr:hypothetical protein [Niastella yeongjuensis]OQP50966.1 hypothetical protein A4H97_03855 [Niastella yeongjuensis]SEN09176.1 hypothetical protein SAMN05660816_00166 [Niastella yeongjuensis]